ASKNKSARSSILGPLSEGQAEALHQLANELIQRALALHRQSQALNRKAKAMHLRK
ncbi:hypothetical protein Tco_1557061, partial [Tanacetum coccineum]